MVINYLLEYIKGETDFEGFSKSKKNKLTSELNISTDSGKTYFSNLLERISGSADKIMKTQSVLIKAGEQTESCN